MTSQPGRGVPLYLQLAAWLRARIISGELRPGDMAPGENQLRDDYNISRATAAKALDQLAAEGLLTRKSGVGSVIRDGHQLQAEVVEIVPGTLVRARMPLPGTTEGWLPLLVITRPGGADEVYDAQTTAVLCVAER